MWCCHNGVSRSSLLHTRSLRGHKDCFEKYHLIANQDCPRSKLSKSTYEGVKTILSKKINWIVQYAQNKDLYADAECPKTSQNQLYSYRHQGDRTLLPQFDSEVPRYSSKWIDGSAGTFSQCSQGILEQRNSTGFGLDMLQNAGATFCHSSVVWSSPTQAEENEKSTQESKTSIHRTHPHFSQEELGSMSSKELEQLNAKLLGQIQDVFEELTHEVQEKDSLTSELHVRHIAIEQLLKNSSKLPCLQMGRAGMKANTPFNN
ncbi:protein EURL homolog isoform X2 [Ambystoma mexicanum]|uniref:protein EURL homolog isoform X2 n=1 Tax=Ambystoma mexicanum TaxID=8296 RepID=UPI0037E90470